MKLIKNLIDKVFLCMYRIPEELISISARIAIGIVFWNSAQTKIAGWDFLGQSWKFFNVTDNTVVLFEYEYALPLISPVLAAYLATLAEFFFGLAVIFGLATRLSALSLFIMTLVIQLLVYPSAWPSHMLWAVGLLYLMKHGPGKLSLDYLLLNKR